MNSNFLLPDNDSLEENNLQATHKMITKLILKSRTFCYGLLALLILISLVIFFGSYFYRAQPQVLKNETIETPEQFQQKTQQLFGDNTYLKSSNINDPLFVKRLVVQGGESLRILSSEFPNLRELIIINPSLRYLEIDPKLKLDVLVVNNTQLETFSYNSSQLRRLTLINNAKMNTFCKSIIPSLEEVFIIKTNITSWYQNSVGNLTKLYFSECSIFSKPEIGSLEIQQIYLDQVYTQQVILQFLGSNNIKSMVISSIYQRFDFNIESQSLNNITFLSCLDNSVSASFSRCPQLRSISFKYAPFILVLSNLHQPVSLQLNDLSGSQKIIIQNVKEVIMSAPLQNCNIRQLIILNSTLSPFTDLMCDSLQYLSVDFALLTYNSFNFSFPALKSLHAQNYKSKEPIQINIQEQNFYGINLYFENTQVPEIIINVAAINQIVISYLTGLQSQPKLNISSKKLQFLYLNKTDIAGIWDWDIDKLDLVRIQNNQKLQTINILPNHLILYNNSLLKINEVQYNCTGLSLYSQPLSKYEINAYFQFLNQLYISLDIRQDFVGYNLNNLQQLMLDHLNITEFSHNSLPSIQSITIDSTSLVNFQNNSLPSLTYLSIPRNPNLNFSVLIHELGSLKSRGTQLKTIIVPKSTSSQIIDSIKQVFPDINVLYQ